MVLLTHIGQMVPILNKYTSIGEVGVKLFFVLSGFLIFKSIESSKSIKNYYKKRVIHIIPIYYTGLIFLYISELIWYSRTIPIKEVLSGVCGYEFLRYFAFLNVIVPSDDWNLWNNRSALWTLSSFFIFYLIAPIIFKLIKKFWQALLLLIVLIFSKPYLVSAIIKMFKSYPEESHIEWFAELNPLSQLYCFVFGIVIYYTIKESKESILLIILGCTLIATRFTKYPYEIIFSMLVMGLFQAKPIITNLRMIKIIQFISAGSFSLYLLHPIILKHAKDIIDKFQLNSLESFTLLITSTIIFSYLFWYVIQRPLENVFKKKLLS